MLAARLPRAGMSIAWKSPVTFCQAQKGPGQGNFGFEPDCHIDEGWSPTYDYLRPSGVRDKSR